MDGKSPNVSNLMVVMILIGGICVELQQARKGIDLGPHLMLKVDIAA